MALRAGFHGTVGQSSAQVIDGSLKFDVSKTQYLTRTPGSVGNQRTWTWSGWLKRAGSSATNKHPFYGAYGGSNETSTMLAYDNSTDDVIRFEDDFINGDLAGRTPGVFRDFSGSGWYHVVISLDTTQSSVTDGLKIYVNGTQQTGLTNTIWNQNHNSNINSTVAQYIGSDTTAANRFFDGAMSQVYLIDGQALGPEYFGYTDPLTNTWRPKKFSGYFNQQIEDFTDTLPILNTNSDGSSVTSGTRTDDLNSNWILGLAMNTSANIYTDLSPSAGNATDYSNIVTSTNTSRFYGTSAYFNGTNSQLVVDDTRFDFSATNFTMETWIYVPSTPTVSETVFCSSNPDLIGSNSTAGVLVGWNSSNQLFVYVGSDSTPSITNSSTTAVSIKKWHHIAIAKSGSTITLYIDGIASGTTTTAVGNSTSGLYVAYQPTNARWFEAYYQDLRVYTTAKYTSNFTPPVGSVNSFYLPMDGNSPIGQDKSGNGNDWTPQGFGGSVDFGNPRVSGARPILNTTQGGTAAGVGVFGSKENKFYTVTTANGSVYQFDITSGDNPSLEFIRGATYRFDYTSHASHPLRFSSTNPDSSTTAYTEGTNTSVSNVITITVPHDAPDTLYYYCTAHASAMNGAITVTTDNTKADQYASSCVLAAPLIFRDMGDVSASITCTTSSKSISNNGDATDTGEQSNFYNRSFKFDGTGDYLSVAQNSDFQLASSAVDFTIEAYVYGSAFSGAFTSVVSVWGGSSGNDQWLLSVNTSGVLGFAWSPYSNGSNFLSGGTLSTNKWHHVAVTRSGNTFRLFLNGIVVASGTDSATSTDNTQLEIGRYGAGGTPSSEWEGYIQDVRIYKGVAKYTSDFVVPSTSPDILPDTPSGVAGGSKLAKITDGSFSNPTSSGIRQFGNISVADSTDLEFGSGDFTLEAFIYYTGNPGTGNSTYTIFSKWNNTSAPTDKGFLLRIEDDSSGDNLQWIYTTDGSTNQSTTGSTLLNPNTWYHIAFVRNGTTGTFYIDGVADSTTVSFGSDSIRDTGNAFRIGANLDGGEIDQEFSGFISNVRVVKGDAVYTGNFTPPAAPLTNITNTKILACQDNDYNVVGITTTAATGASPIFTTTGDYGETYGDGNLNADSNASNLVLCLDFYANATDRMPSGRPSNQKSLSAGGDPNPGNTTTSHLYGKSAYFDGNDSYSISSSADFSFDGEFCVELWANASSWGPFFVSGGTNGIWLGSTSNGLVLRRYGVANDLLVQIPPFNEWVHLAFTRDGSNVLRLFINGEEQASSVSTSTYTQNTLYIGTDGAGSYYTGYIQDLRVYKGTAKYTSDFNPPFRSLNRVKAAVSPSQFRHTKLAGGPVAFNPFNTDINTVRGQETGYCTWNPLDKDNTVSYANGNLEAVVNAGATNSTYGTFSISSGKWYWEVVISGGNGSSSMIGVAESNKGTARRWTGVNGWYYYETGVLYTNTTSTSYGASYTNGDVIGVTLDMDNGNLVFYKNGSSQGTAYSTGTFSGKEIMPAIGNGGGANVTYTVNFGQKPFKFPPPDGFQPLNTANIRPSTVIARPDQYVAVATYAGNATTQHIDVGLRPDFVWIKERTDTGGVSHYLGDTVRGINKNLQSNTTQVEGTNNGYGYVSSVDDKGFTVTQGSQDSFYTNGNPETYVAWTWKAGGNKGVFNIDDVGYASAAAAGLTGGDRTPTGASVGTKQGFSIIKFTGSGSGTPSIPHGLSEAPKFIIQKDTGATTSWRVFAYDGSTWKIGNLNNTDALVSATETAPTSSLFYANGNGNATNTQIAYLWHDVPGLQKFGTYTGNGSITDGTFVELGFKPRIIIFKNSGRGGGSQGWYIYDSERDEINVANKFLVADQGYQEQVTSNNVSLTSYKLDLLSNGFKFYNDGYALNFSGDTYVYAAWAEAPTFNLYGAQSNAR